MLKKGILNPNIARLLAETGHKDTIVVSDAGLPMPLGVERIDLAWKENEPGYIPVLAEILEHIVVEKAILLFREQGQTGERFADTIARLGFENVQAQLLVDDLLERKEDNLTAQVHLKGGATC